MSKFAQLVMGPAGCGKSTYCNVMINHCETLRRSAYGINLDPAAEYFDYPLIADIRELISLQDVMEDDDLKLGPNGGLLFCLEKNFDWLQEKIENEDGNYFFIDLPGQIELYTHSDVISNLILQLQRWDFKLCGVFVIDAQFTTDSMKFISGMLVALTSIIALEIPTITLMSKIDLLSKSAKEQLERYLEPENFVLVEEAESCSSFNSKYKELSHALINVITDYSMVQFYPWDISDEDSISRILSILDLIMQYDEDAEVKEIPDDCL